MNQYKDFLNRIQKAKSMDALINLRIEITNSSLPEKTKSRLLGEVTSKAESMFQNKEKYYVKETRAIIEDMVRRGVIDERVADALNNFLTAIIESKALDYKKKHFRRSVFKLVEWIYRNKLHGKRPVRITDFDIANFTELDLKEFIETTFPVTLVREKMEIIEKGLSTRNKNYGCIRAFGEFLKDRYKEVTFFPIYISKKAKRRSERRKGTPRRAEELDKIFTVLGLRKLAGYRRGVLTLLGRCLLSAGMRYGQFVESFRVSDITNADEWYKIVTCPAFKVEYYEIPAKKIVEREKILSGGVLSSKDVADYIYLPVSLVDDLKDYIEYHKLKEKDRLFGKGFSERNLQTIASEISPILKQWGISKFSFYDFRHTFASVLYNMGYVREKVRDEVRKRGGWESTSKVPFDVYIDLMKPKDAYEIAKDYNIYIDPLTYDKGEVEKTIEEVLHKSAKPRISEEELKMIETRVKEELIIRMLTEAAEDKGISVDELLDALKKKKYWR